MSARPIIDTYTTRGTTLAPVLVRLSVREVEVLRLVAKGLSNEQIARVLVVSPHTAASHLKALTFKLGVTSRAAAVAVGFDVGILVPGEAARASIDAARVARHECESCGRAAPAGSPGWQARLADGGDPLAVVCITCSRSVDVALVEATGARS